MLDRPDHQTLAVGKAYQGGSPEDGNLEVGLLASPEGHRMGQEVEQTRVHPLMSQKAEIKRVYNQKRLVTSISRQSTHLVASYPYHDLLVTHDQDPEESKGVH